MDGMYSMACFFQPMVQIYRQHTLQVIAIPHLQVICAIAPSHCFSPLQTDFSQCCFRYQQHSVSFLLKKIIICIGNKWLSSFLLILSIAVLLHVIMMSPKQNHGRFFFFCLWLKLYKPFSQVPSLCKDYEHQNSYQRMGTDTSGNVSAKIIYLSDGFFFGKDLHFTNWIQQF